MSRTLACLAGFISVLIRMPASGKAGTLVGTTTKGYSDEWEMKKAYNGVEQAYTPM